MIIPSHETRYLLVERVRAQWHQNNMRTAVLENQDESFNERDTSVLANGAEAGRDPLAITPGFERVAPELLALVADNIFWRGTCLDNGAFEEGLDRYRCGIIPVYRRAHSASGVVINDNHHPPEKRPALG